MHVVLDTNVLLSSTLWDGSVAQKLLFKFLKSDTAIFSSEAIISEYKKVLKRDFEYSDEEVLAIVGKLVLFLNFVNPSEKINVIKEDPDDNKVIECALASSSAYLITYDKHLLNLGSFRSIKIMTPEHALGLLGF
ncbi:putative toxin-antitoxin system toxin component, PIN family [Candidatus Woesearchaeota archaeon]|nr:putative toxin-antitoxin system toxin component, PIN family [Candidatus Woesearchaeota archaeon]